MTAVPKAEKKVAMKIVVKVGSTVVKRVVMTADLKVHWKVDLMAVPKAD